MHRCGCNMLRSARSPLARVSNSSAASSSLSRRHARASSCMCTALNISCTAASTCRISTAPLPARAPAAPPQADAKLPYSVVSNARQFLLLWSRSAQSRHRPAPSQRLMRARHVWAGLSTSHLRPQSCSACPLQPTCAGASRWLHARCGAGAPLGAGAPPPAGAAAAAAAAAVSSAATSAPRRHSSSTRRTSPDTAATCRMGQRVGAPRFTARGTLSDAARRGCAAGRGCRPPRRSACASAARLEGCTARAAQRAALRPSSSVRRTEQSKPAETLFPQLASCVGGRAGIRASGARGTLRAAYSMLGLGSGERARARRAAPCAPRTRWRAG